MHDRITAESAVEHLEPAISNRARALALDILHRIRPVCAHMPDAELLALSTNMAVVELRYFEQAATPPVRRRRPAHG